MITDSAFPYNPCRYVLHPDTLERIPIPEEAIAYWKATGVLEYMHERRTRPLDLGERLLIGAGVGLVVFCALLVIGFLTQPFPVNNAVYAVFLASMAVSAASDIWRVWRRL